MKRSNIPTGCNSVSVYSEYVGRCCIVTLVSFVMFFVLVFISVEVWFVSSTAKWLAGKTHSLTVLSQSYHLYKEWSGRATFWSLLLYFVIIALFIRTTLSSAVEMWQSSNSNSTTFELQRFSADLKFDARFKCFLSNANSWKNSCLQLISYAQRARVQTDPVFSSDLTYHTNYPVIECSA